MENTYKMLENLLLENDKYKSEDNTILKAKVFEDAEKLNPDLIELLLDNDKLKEVFFIKLKDILVFDKEKFVSLINSKKFLPDSYTKYSNKIGLTHNNRFISKSNDVVLDFPYKDCVLAGGQTKDDQKREEIVFNEILASDEITRMLAPKVFTNAKRYTKDGVEEDITFNEEDNLIIKGNNLIALSSILERYEGKVKCIYIDPPFNTGNDSFNYNDKFNHSTWLTFMKNRLEIAYKFLKEDGIMLVQCDDNEQAYLKILMDEIFGRNNFIATAPRKTGAGAAATRSLYVLRKPYDFILIYTKDKLKTEFNRLIVGEKEYKYKDNYGNYSLATFQPTGSDATRKKRPNLYYPIYLQNNNSLSLIKNENTIKEILPEKYNDEDGRWMWKKEKFEKDKDQFLYFDGERIQRKIYFNENEDQTKYQVEKAYFDDSKYRNSTGTLELTELFQEKNKFNNPKPEFLIKKIIEIATNKKDLILDFHLGSGTTCAVAHKMGRKYIGIEQMDYINTVTVPRLEKVIQGEQGGISKSLNWQGGGSFVYCELKENAHSLIKCVKNATEKSIDEIKEQIFNDDRIVPYITKKELENANKEFEENSLAEKKKALITLIDKNKLYVNFSDIDDEDYKITERERKFTNSFYKGV